MPEISAECSAIAEDLSALLDEELAAGRSTEVRAHVAACPHCAARLAELGNVDRVLAGLATPAPLDSRPSYDRLVNPRI